MKKIIKDLNIEVLDIPFPKESNKHILSYLTGHSPWNFATDLGQDHLIRDNITKPNGNDYGFYRRTFDNEYQHDKDDFLNTMAQTIKHMIDEKSNFNIGIIQRIYWNMYVNSSTMIYHRDKKLEDNCISIVYNLHSNDGGTNFKDYKTIRSKESQALIFKSDILHKGVAPKKIPFRFCLNMVCINNNK